GRVGDRRLWKSTTVRASRLTAELHSALSMPPRVANKSPESFRTWHEPPNSSQQPTRGRSLARRFRASVCATLRVALPDREGRVRLSERTLARPRSHVNFA